MEEGGLAPGGARAVQSHPGGVAGEGGDLEIVRNIKIYQRFAMQIRPAFNNKRCKVETCKIHKTRSLEFLEVFQI